MPRRITEAEQASRVRISRLTAELFDTIAAQTDANPDLTVEEITSALLRAATEQVGHLWRGQFDEKETP